MQITVKVSSLHCSKSITVTKDTQVINLMLILDQQFMMPFKECACS